MPTPAWSRGEGEHGGHLGEKKSRQATAPLADTQSDIWTVQVQVWRGQNTEQVQARRGCKIQVLRETFSCMECGRRCADGNLPLNLVSRGLIRGPCKPSTGYINSSQRHWFAIRSWRFSNLTWSPSVVVPKASSIISRLVVKVGWDGSNRAMIPSPAGMDGFLHCHWGYGTMHR